MMKNSISLSDNLLGTGVVIGSVSKSAGRAYVMNYEWAIAF